MFTQASQHCLVQLLPDTSGIPVAQAPPASYAAAVPKGLGKVFPWNACLQHEQDADRKSTRLNSSHLVISYAVFCLKKKKITVSASTVMRLAIYISVVTWC